MSDSFVRLFCAPITLIPEMDIGEVTLVTLLASTLFISSSFLSLLKEREKVSLLSLRPCSLQKGDEKSITLLSPKYHLFRISFFISTNKSGARAWAV